MKLLLVLITTILGDQEHDSDDQEAQEPWWDVSRRTPNSEIIEQRTTTSIPALSLFNYDNNNFKSNETVRTEFADNEEEMILSPFLVNPPQKFESSDLNNILNRSQLFSAPDFNNILDAEEIYTNRDRMKDNIDTEYLESSVDSVVDNSDFEKRLMTRLKQLLGLSMSGEITDHGGAMHG